jgi:hypothetical protein
MSEYTKGLIGSVSELGKLSYRKEGVAFAIFSGRFLVAKLAGSLYDNAEVARRLVACWNACEGMTTEEVECMGRIADAPVVTCEPNDELIEALRGQREYFLRLKHRADVRGGPDVSAMGIADEAVEQIDALLAKHAPQDK